MQQKDNDQFSFINEKIKEKPVNKKRLLMQAGFIALMAGYIKETFILLFTMAGACLIVFLVPGLFVLFPESSAASPAI